MHVQADPVVVQQTNPLKVGEVLEAQLGRTSGISADQPLVSWFKIKAYSDGTFKYGGPMMHEVKADIGPSILLKIDSIEIGAALIKPSCWIVF
ncbi:hypothetical protein CU478_01110 [Acinetobacter pseudolwoffii]|nr:MULTISPECIES: MlrC C-terminal domain-containing protein [Acinetobacter]PJI30908.1 hypothetical protein CU478_01110 [Acinetobacter pseudolwoffii]PJI36564.1 hypothetical protein CU318_03300 [Acinetobacter pseudolwoffii]